jgi:hypothetical protein
MTACRSCGAPIRWAYTVANRAMPLDAKAEQRLVIGDDGIARWTATYQSHFVSCPNAAEHRQSRSTTSKE